MAIELKNFSAKTEARLLKVRYDALPIAVGGQVNLTAEDEVVITRIEKNSISFECTRNLITNPKSIFEISATCLIKRFIEPKYDDIDLTKENIDEFVQQNLATLVSLGFTNMSYTLSNITSLFGNMPFVTSPTPVPTCKIKRYN